MDAVLEFADVTVRRGDGHRCSTASTGRSRRTSAGWSSGPTAPARPRCCRSPRRRSTRPPASPGILGEVLGTVDVFELRPADRADQRRARRADPARTSGCATWSSPRRTAWSAAGARSTTTSTTTAPRELLARGRRRPPRRPHLRHPERGRAQAGPDRPCADDRPRAAAARRAGGRARPRRPRGPRLDAVDARRWTRPRRRRCWSPTTWRRSRPASPTRCCCATGGSSRPARSTDVLTEEHLSETFGMPLVLQHEDGRWAARRRPPAPADRPDG